MIVLFLMIMLPLLEIAGFIVIGGDIGVGLSLLWVIADVIVGFALLAAMGEQTLMKAKTAADAGAYPFEEMFDGFCILIGALLLIFPGFISDVLALPLLIAPLRGLIFRFLRNRHDDMLQRFGKTTRGFTYWYYEEKGDGGVRTIEGEFRSGDDDKKIT